MDFDQQTIMEFAKSLESACQRQFNLDEDQIVYFKSISKYRSQEKFLQKKH